MCGWLQLWECWWLQIVKASVRNLIEGIRMGWQGECGEVINSQTSTWFDLNGEGDHQRFHNKRLRDNNINNFENVVETCYNRLRKSCSWLLAEESVMMNTKGAVQCIEEWYLDYEYSNNMKGRKNYFIKISHTMKNKAKFVNDATLAAESMIF